MENTNKIAEKLGIKSRLELFRRDTKGIPQPTGPHRVKFVGDEIVALPVKLSSGTKDVQHVRLLVDEGGTEKIYDFPIYKISKGEIMYQDEERKKPAPHYLIERLKDIPVGAIVVLEGKKEHGTTFISVSVDFGEDVSHELVDEGPAGEEAQPEYEF